MVEVEFVFITKPELHRGLDMEGLKRTKTEPSVSFKPYPHLEQSYLTQYLKGQNKPKKFGLSSSDVEDSAASLMDEQLSVASFSAIAQEDGHDIISVADDTQSHDKNKELSDPEVYDSSDDNVSISASNGDESDMVMSDAEQVVPVISAGNPDAKLTSVAPNDDQTSREDGKRSISSSASSDGPPASLTRTHQAEEAKLSELCEPLPPVSPWRSEDGQAAIIEVASDSEPLSSEHAANQVDSKIASSVSP